MINCTLASFSFKNFYFAISCVSKGLKLNRLHDISKEFVYIYIYTYMYICIKWFNLKVAIFRQLRKNVGSDHLCVVLIDIIIQGKLDDSLLFLAKRLIFEMPRLLRWRHVEDISELLFNDLPLSALMMESLSFKR